MGCFVFAIIGPSSDVEFIPRRASEAAGVFLIKKLNEAVLGVVVVMVVGGAGRGGEGVSFATRNA